MAALCCSNVKCHQSTSSMNHHHRARCRRPKAPLHCPPKEPISELGIRRWTIQIRQAYVPYKVPRPQASRDQDVYPASLQCQGIVVGSATAGREYPALQFG